MTSGPPPLRVMYLINGLGTGGAERSLADLLPALEARSIDVEVLCLWRRAEGVQQEVLASTSVRFLNEKSWLGRIRSVRRVVHSDRPDILHTTLFESDIVGRLATIGTEVPVLTSLVNTSYDPARLEADPNLRSARLMAARILDGLTARHRRVRFHALSAAVKVAAVERLHLDPSKITVVARARNLSRLGNPTPERRQAARAALGLADQDLALLAVGRQEFQKGHVHLLEAAASLRLRRPRLRLLLAGREGNATNQLRNAIARLDLEDAVTLLGHRIDVGDLLTAADVFCFPSIYEGFGGAVIEAMAMGVPVACSDLPALREVLGEEGAVFFTLGSASAISEAIEALISNPAKRESMVRMGQARVAERYDLESIADQMAALYRDTARRERSARHK